MILRTERLVVPFSGRQSPTHRVPHSSRRSIAFARTSSRNADFEYLLKKFKHVTRHDLEYLRDTLYTFEFFEIEVFTLDKRKEFWNKKGKRHFEAGPLVEVLSAQILPHKVDENQQLAIYGRIYIEFYDIRDGHTLVHDLFNRGCSDPEILDSTNLNLTLDYPLEFSYKPPDAITVQETKIVVDLWDAHQRTVFARDTFLLKDVSIDEYEQLDMKVIKGTWGSLAVRYMSMLFGIHCYVDVFFYQRKEDKNRPVLNVYGDIVVRYGNTHGNYVDEGCTVFRKLSYEFDQVILSVPGHLNISRGWLSVPAYSSVIIDIDLFDFNTKAPIFKGAVELVPDYQHADEAFAIDDYVMLVTAMCYSRIPDVCRLVSDDEEEEEEDEDEDEDVEEEEEEDEEDEEEDEEDEYEDEEERNNPWYHRTRVPGLFDSGAFEVFTIFIGRDKMLKSVRLFGTIEVSSFSRSFYIFRRDEEDAFELSEHCKFLPIVDAFGYVFEPSHQLKLKFDLKDVDGNLFINGFIEWHDHTLSDPPSRYDSQLCSVIAGEHGFAAVHFSIFEWAFQTNIEASYKLKKCGSYAVYGSLIAEYDTYDYSTSFQKDCYRIVLFERAEQDMLLLGIDGKIPLPRSTVILPADSSALIIEANVKVMDLSTGVARQDLSHLEIKAGTESASMETEVCLINFQFKWKTEK